MTGLILNSTHGFNATVTVNTTTEQIVLNLPTTEELYPGLEKDYYVGVSTQLESLMLSFSIAPTSLGISPTPHILPTDSESEKQAKIANVQSKFPKVGLALLLDTGDGFKERAVAVLQNFDRETYFPLLVPYFTMSEVLLLNEKDKLAVKIKDFGNGLLKIGDKILIHGTFKQERTCVPKVIAVASLKYAGVYKP